MGPSPLPLLARALSSQVAGDTVQFGDRYDTGEPHTSSCTCWASSAGHFCKPYSSCAAPWAARSCVWMGDPEKFTIKFKTNFTLRKNHLIGEPQPKSALFTRLTSTAIICFALQRDLHQACCLQGQPSELNPAGPWRELLECSDMHAPQCWQLGLDRQ